MDNNPARFCGLERFSKEAAEYARATAIFGTELEDILIRAVKAEFSILRFAGLGFTGTNWKASFRYKRSVGTESLGDTPTEAILGALLLALDHQTWIEANPAADPLSPAGQRRLKGFEPARAKSKSALILELKDLFPEGI